MPRPFTRYQYQQSRKSSHKTLLQLDSNLHTTTTTRCSNAMKTSQPDPEGIPSSRLTNPQKQPRRYDSKIIHLEREEPRYSIRNGPMNRNNEKYFIRNRTSVAQMRKNHPASSGSLFEPGGTLRFGFGLNWTFRCDDPSS